MIDLLGGALPREACSRAGCSADATWRIDWRNPRIHTGDRFKTWLACDEHVDYLRDFLAALEFPLAVKTLESGPSESAQGEPGQGDEVAS